MENVPKKRRVNGISKGFVTQCNGCWRSALVAGVFDGHPRLRRQPRGMDTSICLGGEM